MTFLPPTSGNTEQIRAFSYLKFIISVELERKNDFSGNIARYNLHMTVGLENTRMRMRYFYVI